LPYPVHPKILQILIQTNAVQKPSRRRAWKREKQATRKETQLYAQGI